ncbi:MAG: glycosyltransferase family 4 protein [Phycisphaerales bacterium]|jgi:glycosyltransferase involved in cell wall biosynthesis|nr:glycosyltransferase family 4 protein [Phycisphaerales bacterium]
MNYQTLRALERLGHRVSMVVAPGGGAGGDGGGSLRGLARRHLTPGGRERLRTLSWRLRGQIRPGATSEAFLAHARQRAAHAEETLAAIEREHGRVDCLAVTVSSVPAYGLRQAWPIVYFSDITARIANTSYEAFAGRGGAYHRASEQVERESLARMFRAAFASEASLRSAIADHGLDPARGVLAPMGPNVGVPDDAPEAMLREIEAPTPPTRACVRMLVVAADPVRKRLDLCVEAVERLRARGIGAELTSIGGTTPRFRAAMARWPGVFHSLGMLRLGDERDAARQREAMLTSHLMLLASTGEAYGIAPVEMAHFGRPSIVSDAGGLTTVVRNGETGIVLPVGALGRTWADEIERLVDDPERYRTLARGALERARRELNWDAWTATIGRMIEEAVRTPIPHA